MKSIPIIHKSLRALILIIQLYPNSVISQQDTRLLPIYYSSIQHILPAGIDPSGFIHKMDTNLVFVLISHLRERCSSRCRDDVDYVRLLLAVPDAIVHVYL